MRCYELRERLYERSISNIQNEENAPKKYSKKIVTLITQEEFCEEVSGTAHVKTMRHFLNQIDYTRVELFGSCIVGTLCMPMKEQEKNQWIRLGFYILEEEMYLIGEEETLETLFFRVKENQFNEDITLCDLFCQLLNLWIDDDALYLQKVGEHLADIEVELVKGEARNLDREILPYRRKMMDLQSYYYQLMNLGMAFRSNTNQMLSEEACIKYGYFSGRAERLHRQVEAIREYILQIRDMYQTQIALGQSKSMNLLTVVSAIFLPLTLLVGWYGMNFTTMPELASEWGYPGVIIASITIIGIEIYIFHKKHLW